MRSPLPLLFALILSPWCLAADSLPPLQDGRVPENLSQLWGTYDPRAEPLEAEVTTEWEQDGVVCRVVRYRIGTFKEKPATMAAFYAFPKGAKSLPAILQIHGGGQSASLSAVVTYAKLGYVGLSLNWGGNKMSLPEGKTYDGPNTDWGALDATHPPQRNKANHFAGGTEPDAYTLDAVDSPRNDNWFLVTLAARRALTFLEQQPEVDPTKLGATGHSMGGRLTVQLTGMDDRVKAAVPSCGGSGDFTADPARFPGGSPSKRSPRDLATRSENPYIARLKVPTLWFSPTNDFHAHLYHFASTWREVPDALLGCSISPHFNHRSSDDHSLTATLWFEQHLKGAYHLPRTPQLRWERSVAGGEATFTVTPDAGRAVKAVRVYATADAHALTAFWRTVPATQAGKEWKATVPVLDARDPLFVYADVSYETPEAYRNIPTTPGVGRSDTFALSSRVLTLTGAELAAAGVRASAQRDRSIDAGLQGWQDWFRLNWGNPTLWTATTRKVKDPLWRGPLGARLAFEIHPENDTVLYVSVTRNAWGAFGGGSGEYYAAVPLKANGSWVEVRLGVEDFQPTDPRGATPLADWSTLTELTLSGHATVVKEGAKTPMPSTPWKNAAAIRVRQLRWVGGQYQGEAPSAKELSDAERTKAFNDAIKASLEQERKDREGK
ncbi:MAG: hypothetical protein RLZZ142_2105 [Verrucomicrobiota bacterium]